MSGRRAELEGDGLTVRPGGEPGVRLFGVTLSRGESTWGVEESLGSRNGAGDPFSLGLRQHGAGLSRHPRSPFAWQPSSPSPCPPVSARPAREGRLLFRTSGPSSFAGLGLSDGTRAAPGVLDIDASSRRELHSPAAEQGALTSGRVASVCMTSGWHGVHGRGGGGEAVGVGGGNRGTGEATMLLSTETMREQGGEDFSENDSARELETANKERKKGVPWSAEEHRLFLLGLQELGKGDWRGISRKFVLTRTPTQVASHAQKYFIRQANQNKRKRRASLLDIGTESLASDSAMPRSLSTPALPTDCDRARPSATTAGPGSINPLPRSPLSSATFSRGDAKEPLGRGEPRASLQYPASAPGFPSSLPAAAPLHRPDPSPPSGPERQSMHSSGHSQETRFECAPPNVDISRTWSYPSVRAAAASQEGPDGLARPDSMPLIGSHFLGPRPTASPDGPKQQALDCASKPGAECSAKFLDGPGSSSGTLEAAAAAWTALHECIKAASSGSSGPATPACAPPMAAMDLAAKQRLGQDIIAEIMSRQFGQPCSTAAAPSRAGAPKSVAGPAYAWTPGAPQGMASEPHSRREAAPGSAPGYNDGGVSARVASCSPAGKLASVSPVAQPVFSLLAADSGGKPTASQSISQDVRVPPMGMTSPPGNPTAATSSAAGAAAAANAATDKPYEAGAWVSQSIPPWLTPSGAWVPCQPKVTPCPAWSTAGKPFSGPTAHVPSAAAHGLRGTIADTYHGKAPEVFWPPGVRPSAAHNMPGMRLGVVASQPAEPITGSRAPIREHAGTLMLLGEGIGEAKEAPASGPAAAEVREDAERAPSVTLQLFGAAQQPSAFQATARVSPDSADVGQAPISVP